MDVEAEQYYSELEAEIEAEARLCDPVHQRLELVSFVSRSKGRGRKRKGRTEVELVHDKQSGKYTSWDKYPFDVYGTEILPMVHPADVDEELRRRLRE